MSSYSLKWIIKEAFSLLLSTLREIRNIPTYRREIRDVFYETYIGSLPLVLIVSIFVGLVTGAEACYLALPGTPPHLIGSGIFRGIILEVGPVLLGLLIVGRVGAGISSELGSMKISEQIDALRAMGISPAGYLVLPRVVSGIVAAPLLLIIGYWFAILSAYLMVSKTISAFEFVKGIKMFFLAEEVFIGLAKATSFGFIATFTGSFFGLSQKEGARGVGYATMLSVVSASLLILFANYLLTMILL